MFVTIFFAYLFCGIMFHICRLAANDAEEGSKAQKVANFFKYFFVGVVMLGVASLVLYVIGWIWYYLCAGGLMFEDDATFGDIVGYGFVSVLCLGFVLTFLAGIAGWRPGT